MDPLRKRQLAIIIAAFCLILIADQVTKAIVVAKIPEGHAPPGADRRFFYFAHEKNPGLVGGMFRDRPWIARTAPLVATVVLVYLFRHLDVYSLRQALAYGMVAGGAGGNLIDRIRLGHVTDFLQFYFYFIPFDFPWKRYPAFNVADSAICVGVFLLIVSWHKVEGAERRAADHT